MVYKRRRVALLIETSEERGRAIIRGIIRYANLYGLWDFHVTPGEVKQQASSLTKWNGDGIVARVESGPLASVLVAKKLPLILLGHPATQPSEFEGHGPYYHICMRNYQLGETAAEYFLRKGVTSFAYFSSCPEVPWSKEREKGFRDYLIAREVPPESIYSLNTKEKDGIISFGRDFRSALKELPKPAAILAFADRGGQKLIECCSAMSVDVPREVIVLGIDNDELLCVSSSPPLSSISIDAEGAGFRAAGILDRMMSNPGEVLSQPQIIPLEPVMIHERPSTSTDHFADHMVSEIFEFLRLNINSCINVSDVVRAMKKSRRVLEIRFKTVTGETIHDAIIRLKLHAVKQFLVDTNLPLRQIAEETGFGEENYLGQLFKKKFGMTMDTFRKNYRKE